MKYINANHILPKWLVRQLQTYVQGGYIYVPADPAGKSGGAKCPATGRSWTNATGRSVRLTEAACRRRVWLKNTACPYTPFAKSFTKNKEQRLHLQPLSVSKKA